MRTSKSILFRLLATLFAAALLLSVELLARLTVEWPTEPAEVFLARRDPSLFSPFDVQGEQVSIRADWVNDGDEIRHELGADNGLFYLYPGFRSSRFSVKKPAKTIRIFVLGGSTTFGLFAGGSQFASVLQQRLPDAFPGAAIEVINLGCPGWASDRVSRLAKETQRFDPDLLIVYSGHNEYLGLKIGGESEPSLVQRTRARLWSASLTFAWLDVRVRAGNEQQEALTEAEYKALDRGLIPILDPADIGEDRRPELTPRQLSSARVEFVNNLEAMARDAQNAGVPLLLVMPVSQLLQRPHLSAVDIERSRDPVFQELVSGARQLIKAGDVEGAIPKLDRAIEITASDPMIRFWRATAYTMLGREEQALHDYRTARDDDARPFRMTSALEQALHSTARRLGITVVDEREFFETNRASEPALFADHCHLTPRGHEILAEAMIPAIIELLGQN